MNPASLSCLDLAWSLRSFAFLLHSLFLLFPPPLLDSTHSRQ